MICTKQLSFLRIALLYICGGVIVVAQTLTSYKPINGGSTIDGVLE